MIDANEVLADLQAIVSEYGDGYRYVPPRGNESECAYIHDGKPSCIVGHVFARHELLNLETALLNAGLNGDENGYDGPTELLRYFTHEAALVLAVAQQVQDDTRNTWGDALIAAKEACSSS